MDKKLKLKVYKELLKITKKEYYETCDLVDNLYTNNSKHYSLLNKENLLRKKIYAIRNEIKEILKEI